MGEHSRTNSQMTLQQKRKEGIACKECGIVTAIIEISGAGRIERVDFTCDNCDVTTKFKRQSISGGTPVKMTPGQIALPKEVQAAAVGGDGVSDEALPSVKARGRPRKNA